jgi:hypothetical protein
MALATAALQLRRLIGVLEVCRRNASTCQQRASRTAAREGAAPSRACGQTSRPCEQDKRREVGIVLIDNDDQVVAGLECPLERPRAKGEVDRGRLECPR